MFHVSQGLYFKRLDDGSVLIEKRENAGPDVKIIFEQVITPECWASIVSTVSISGETSDTYKAAYLFHGGCL